MEIISRSPERPSGHKPLLFLHGAFGGAWMWDEHFLPYFAKQGYEAHALSLRGHGESEDARFVHSTGLADYIDDLNKAVLSLRETPILIGHSLGGVVVQKWLKHHKAPGTVLVGSGPPHGMLPSTMRMMLRAPTLVMQIALAQTFGPKAATSEAARRVLFSEGVPIEVAKRHFARASAESLRVAFELTLPDFREPARCRDMPVLVLGAEDDFFVSPTMVQATAEVYNTKAEIFPDMAHAMMLEPDWQSVADRILRWIEEEVAA